MKTLVKLMFFVTCLGLCFSCSQPDEFLEEAPTIRKKAKIGVKPSNASDVMVKAEEDWNNINDALQIAEPGEVVQLAEGLFYLHKSIIRWDFNGILRGSGMDKTTIETAPGIVFDVSKCPLLEWSFQAKEGHSIICFPHNSNNEKRTVVVSDLTIIGSEPATEWLDGSVPKNDLQAIIVYYKNLIGISGYLGDPTLSDQINLNVSYKNISVIGNEDPTKYMGHRFSIGIGLAAFGASNGNFEAKNISMDNVEYCITTHAFCGQNSTVSMKKIKIKNADTGIYSWTNNFWEIKENEFIDCAVNAIELNTYNHLFTTPFKGAVIKNNHFAMNSQWNGISGFRMNNVQVRDNTFYGNCFSGILAGRGDYWEIKDNDFCKLNVANPEGATIRLNNTLNSMVRDNSNQVVGGNSASDPSNYVGEEVNCDDND